MKAAEIYSSVTYVTEKFTGEAWIALYFMTFIVVAGSRRNVNQLLLAEVRNAVFSQD